MVVPQRKLGLDMLGLAARTGTPAIAMHDWADGMAKRLREV